MFQFGNILQFSCTAPNAFIYNKRCIVSGIPPSLLFKTINHDELSETSFSYLLSFLWGCFLFIIIINWNLFICTQRIQGAMHNSSPPLSPPTTECHLNFADFRRKVSGILRMVYSNRRIDNWTQASYQGWFLDETTVLNTNYSIDSLAVAFPWLFGRKNSIIYLFSPGASVISPRGHVQCPTILFHLLDTECQDGRHLNSEDLRKNVTGTHSNSATRISYRAWPDQQIDRIGSI